MNLLTTQQSHDYEVYVDFVDLNYLNYLNCSNLLIFIPHIIATKMFMTIRNITIIPMMNTTIIIKQAVFKSVKLAIFFEKIFMAYYYFNYSYQWKLT